MPTPELNISDNDTEAVTYDDTTIYREIVAVHIAAAGGGTLEVIDPASPLVGTRITIPPGALAADHTVTISEVDNPPPLPARIELYRHAGGSWTGWSDLPR